MAHIDKTQGFAFRYPNGQEIRIYNGRIYFCTPTKGNVLSLNQLKELCEKIGDDLKDLVRKQKGVE